MTDAASKDAVPSKTQVNAKDAVAGGLMIAIAAIGLYLNRDYELGTASRMGPGYMPMLVLGLLGLLGLGTLVLGLYSGPERMERWAWRELGLILAAMTVFAVFLQQIGLAASVVLLVAISAFADRSQTLKGAAALAAVLVAICWLVFVYGLNLGLPFLPPFLGFN